MRHSAVAQCGMACHMFHTACTRSLQHTRHQLAACSVRTCGQSRIDIYAQYSAHYRAHVTPTRFAFHRPDTQSTRHCTALSCGRANRMRCAVPAIAWSAEEVRCCVHACSHVGLPPSLPLPPSLSLPPSPSLVLPLSKYMRVMRSSARVSVRLPESVRVRERLGVLERSTLSHRRGHRDRRQLCGRRRAQAHPSHPTYTMSCAIQYHRTAQSRSQLHRWRTVAYLVSPK